MDACVELRLIADAEEYQARKQGEPGFNMSWKEFRGEDRSDEPPELITPFDEIGGEYSDHRRAV